jgi:hypothetical protein
MKEKGHQHGKRGYQGQKDTKIARLDVDKTIKNV